MTPKLLVLRVYVHMVPVNIIVVSSFYLILPNGLLLGFNPVATVPKTLGFSQFLKFSKN